MLLTFSVMPTLLAALGMLFASEPHAAEIQSLLNLPEATLVNTRQFGEKMIAAYPSTPIRLDVQYNVTIICEVSELGRASRCYILKSSGNPIIDRWVSKSAERYARFSAAKNDRGEPIKSQWSDKINSESGNLGQAD